MKEDNLGLTNIKGDNYLCVTGGYPLTHSSRYSYSRHCFNYVQKVLFCSYVLCLTKGNLVVSELHEFSLVLTTLQRVSNIVLFINRLMN